MVQQLYVHIILGQAEQAAKVASDISLQEYDPDHLRLKVTLI